MEKKAEIFLHPISLIYTVGKNLIVNGLDLIKKVADAMVAFYKNDYYTFGKYIGQALDEVFFKTQEKVYQTKGLMTKNLTDEVAY